jgi:hypothetical protein
MMWPRRILGPVNKKNRRRRCRCCQKLFRCDPRARAQQHYCSEPACRAASKKASQQRWLEKPENQDYFRGPQHVQRVQVWRATRRDHEQKAAKAGSSLQETRSSQAVDRLRKSDPLALQETRRSEVLEAPDRTGLSVGATLQDAM